MRLYTLYLKVMSYNRKLNCDDDKISKFVRLGLTD